MLLSTLLQALDQIAPLHQAEPWDNVGLLIGDPQQDIARAMLTIDYTAEVAAEAQNLNCDFIIAYHPPLFSPIKRLTAAGPTALLHDAIRRGVALYSPHTAWDAAKGGTNDYLADSLGLTQVRPLRQNPGPATFLKLVTFVPAPQVDAVSDALFRAGAGHIGNYSCCSFRTPGTGTFFGQPGTHPAVGQPGVLEHQPEIRLETILPLNKLSGVVAALLASHPYEEPAYDLTPLVVPPMTGGHGRIGMLPAAVNMKTVIDRIKTELNLPHLLSAGPADRSIQTIAICPGAGGDLLDNAITEKADLYLTGELRHHDALKADAAGVNVICTLHSNCERHSLTRLKARLEQLPGNPPEFFLSQSDRDPFSVR